MNQRRYALLDVFTEEPLAGNPLAVVFESDDLDDARMQAIAAEFNLSETVFVRPPENPVHSAAIRIFTPRRELPFAGHPTVGAAALLGIEAAGENTANQEMVLVLEEAVGPIRCGVTVKGAASGHVIFDLPRLPEDAGPAGEKDAIAAALNLAPLEIGFENHQLCAFSAGLPYVFAPVRDHSVLARATPNATLLSAACGDKPVYAYCRGLVGSGHRFRARMFAPSAGIAEDPATGSAVAAFAGVIMHFDQPQAGSHHYVIEQGFEMGRPSLISLEVDVDGGLHAARIGGDAVIVARGTLSV